MPRPVELFGQAASPGIASGPLVWVGRRTGTRRIAGGPEQEKAALAAAIEASIASLSVLMEAADEEDAAGMLAFQIAMLEDETLSAPALEAIALGSPADAAWEAALAPQVAEYEAAEDDYFRARASDLKDLRDRVLRHLSGETGENRPKGAILAGEDASPTLFLETDWSEGGGLVLSEGSINSHVAILARARGVPMVVGVGAIDPAPDAEAIVNGTCGRVILNPDAAAKAEAWADAEAERQVSEQATRYLARPAATADGTPVKVLINVAGPQDVERIDPVSCDGIGLMRTEFLFRDGEAFPDEDTQYRAYRKLLEWAGTRPVTIRTLDIGGDKPIKGLTVEGEANAFLGVRGIRLSLKRPEVFRVQLRALARAAVHGTLKVMWPMVTVPEELDEARALFEESLAGLKARGVPAARPPLGMMVEVPAAAITPERFSAAEFFSIGSNDLLQYVAAASRDNGAVASLAEASLPAVLALIGGLAEHARKRGIEVSICGDLAGDPMAASPLLKAGLRSLSVAPVALARVKAAVAQVHLGSVHDAA
ncbi:MAG: phosphoenolpyruvate--protein phosphotransferase [Parvibaculaceae bacterium]